MLILPFLRTLAVQYKELNPTISMCYHMHDRELYLGNAVGPGACTRTCEWDEKRLIRPDNHTECFKELIIETNKKVKCIYVDEMYFMPGGCDEAIIWAKDLNVLLQNNWKTKNIEYDIVKF